MMKAQTSLLTSLWSDCGDIQPVTTFRGASEPIDPKCMSGLGQDKFFHEGNKRSLSEHTCGLQSEADAEADK